MRTISQFMWGFQAHFRFDLERAAKEAFKAIGVTVAPVALLIGFEEEAGGHPICIEPETLGIPQETFAACTADGDAAYEVHEHRGILTTDRGQHERFHAGLRDKCCAEAIAEALASCPGFDDRRWIVGRSARVARYRVYPVIGVLRASWDSLPSLSRRDGDHRTEMFLSLQEAVIRELLRSASLALALLDEPQALLRHDREEIVRRATKSFISQLVYFKGDFRGGDLDSAMNSVAAQPYEGRTGVGTMLMAAESDCQLDLVFERPIGLSMTRALRKALEMTDPDLNLVTDGAAALGLGRLREEYRPESESAFSLRVTGRGSWELEHAGTPLLAVTDGQAIVPRHRLDRERFTDVVGRLFGKAVDIDRLWDLALAASRQAHGTMLVVHGNAKEEAARLSPPAMRTAPQVLTDATLLAVSAIDGAIVVDPLGHCHAIGAILDGRAAPELGDASRGARYNSAHRYLAEADGACLIIIVSEDGMLNLIPELPRRVKKSYVEDVLSDTEVLSRRRPVDFEVFYKREAHLRSLAFYLSQEQCDRANEALERVEQYRESSFVFRDGLGGITRAEYSPYVPDARLDDTYFVDEVDL